VDEVTGRGVRGAASFEDYVLSGFKIQFRDHGSDTDFWASLGSFEAHGMDATAFLRKIKAAAGDFLRTGSTESLEALHNMGILLTLPYALDSYAAHDLEIRTPGMTAGLASLSWKGPAEPGRLYDTRGTARGAYLKPEPGKRPDWLKDTAKLAELLMLPEFRLDLAFSMIRDPRTGLTLCAIDSLNASDLFRVSLRVTLAGIDQKLADRLTELTVTQAYDPAKLFPLIASPEARALGLVGASLSYSDQLFAYRLASLLASDRISMPDVADGLERIIAEEAGSLGAEANPGFAAAIRSFISRPGSFTLEWRPDEPVTLDLVAANASSPPADLYLNLAKLFLSVEGGPEQAMFR
jgi:hypothetical protein